MEPESNHTAECLVVSYNSGGVQNCCFTPEERCLEVTMKNLHLAQITLPVLQQVVLIFCNVSECLSVSMFSCKIILLLSMELMAHPFYLDALLLRVSSTLWRSDIADQQESVWLWIGFVVGFFF